MASSSSTSESPSEPLNNTAAPEENLLGRLAKLWENKEQISAFCKQKNEQIEQQQQQQPQESKLDKKLMEEIQANYYKICAQEYEFLKAMQSKKPYQKNKHKIEYMKKLRDEKKRIILILRSMREKLTEDEEVDKTLIAEMLAKYDMLSFQEEELYRSMRGTGSNNYQIPKHLGCESVTNDGSTGNKQKET
uniref:Uncharacterized protein n=1 Tax=Syphacia muris TaxID=451379 RepID=A0A0N5ALX8_9BILA